MSKSLEALEKLLDLITIYSYWVEAHSYCDTIKQDLERLEQLEKEYKLLDETMEADDRIICQLSEEKEQLEKENQELRDKLNEIKSTIKKHSNATEKFVDELWEENKKLTKAIEIIKSKNVDFRLLNDCNFNLEEYNDNVAYNRELTKEELEVLGE